MRDRKVLVVDYGVGNLLSVCRALEHCGAEVEMSGDPRALLSASRVVLPGVGAFGDCRRELRARGLDDAVIAHVGRDKPLLGICVGMQMLFDLSEEFGSHEGLGIIAGRVEGIPATDASGAPLKVPHIGWSELIPAGDNGTKWGNSVLTGLQPRVAMYFVHSYAAFPENEADRLADASYGERRIAAAVSKGAVVGTQFHPEKSGPSGLVLIQNFLDQ